MGYYGVFLVVFSIPKTEWDGCQATYPYWSSAYYFAVRHFLSGFCTVRLHVSAEEINPQFEGDESAEESGFGQESYAVDVHRRHQFDFVHF